MWDNHHPDQRHIRSAVLWQHLLFCTLWGRKGIGIYLFLMGTIVMSLTFGCRNRTPIEAVPPASEPVVMETPESISVADDTTVLPPSDRQLVLWAPPFFQATTDLPADDPLQLIYKQFEREHPGVHIDVQIRAENGEAGIVNYLRGAERLAPAILPDVMLVDTQQLWQAAELGLVVPLQQTQLFTGTEVFSALLPAAMYDNQFLGVPYFVDLTHALHTNGQLAAVPNSWEELLTAELSYLFAAGKSEAANEFVSLQYLGAGGDFSSEELLSEDQLRTLFSTWIQARDTGVFSASVLELAGQDRAWAQFPTAERSLLETSSHLMLEHWEAVGNETVVYGTVPTLGGTDIALARVWAFAVVATEPEQQELSLSLISAFLDPAIHSKLSHAVMYVPAQPSTYEIWRGSSPYFDFLRAQMDQTVALPNGRWFSDLNRRLQYVLDLILRNEMSAEEAVLYVQTAP